MHREGHLGAALGLYAPVGFFTYVAGSPVPAVAGAGVACLLAMLPDQDIRIPLVSHRGITHTVWFALLIGGVLGAAGAFLGGQTGTQGVLGAGGFGFVVGFVTIASHILADALTPMGVKPFAPLRNRTYTLALVTASNPIANYALLLVGGALAGGALYLGTVVSA